MTHFTNFGFILIVFVYLYILFNTFNTLIGLNVIYMFNRSGQLKMCLYTVVYTSLDAYF